MEPEGRKRSKVNWALTARLDLVLGAVEVRFPLAGDCFRPFLDASYSKRVPSHFLFHDLAAYHNSIGSAAGDELAVLLINGSEDHERAGPVLTHGYHHACMRGRRVWRRGKVLLLIRDPARTPD